MSFSGAEKVANADSHESGEGPKSSDVKPGKGKAPSFNAGKSKSRYNPATHSMRGGSSGYAGKESKVRSLNPQEHRKAAAALHSAGLTHAAAHHISAAEAMEQEAPQVGAGTASMANGMYGNKTGTKPKLAGPMAQAGRPTNLPPNVPGPAGGM